MKSSISVFLAHAKEDKTFVRKLYKRLKESGLDPWLDEENLMPGVKWDDEIINTIKNAKFFIACISKNSVTKDGYIQKELRTALSTLEQKSSNSTYFIPALIEDVKLPNITVGTIKLSDYQAIKIFTEDGLNKLINFLRKESNLVEEIKRQESPSFDVVREEVSNGKTDTALRLLIDYVKKNEPDYLNNLTLISSRFNRVRNDNVLGLISQENYAMESNKIVFSILETIKYLESN